jgi:hypothetical protein
MICSICLYVSPRLDLDGDSRAETELLTVISGHMVCLRHAPCARGTHHDAITSAIQLEAGRRMSLDEYQKWRGATP